MDGGMGVVEVGKGDKWICTLSSLFRGRSHRVQS